MSKSIDERVVQMEFDNARFEKNVSTSMSTIDRLKKSLNFDKSTKSFDKISESAKNVSLSGVTKAVEAVNVKFSAMQVAGITALANITNSAVNTGRQLARSLTVDPVKLGLAEYETQINAIQTIMANTSSKGTTLDQVNSALDELNHYADMTIYNFTEMTRNIGTFTAAGVGLEASVSAIKGIANLAAVSGSTSYQASTAMYQLSQALAAGTVKLQDWNSVVNAGMGGEVFQSALKDTARVHGIEVDDMIKKQGSFRESLKDGWITTSVLTETLAKFTGDLNAEQLKSIGYTEEQVAAIIKMGQTANDAATKVKTFSQLIDTLKEAAQSGWTQSWEIIIGNFDEAKAVFTEASDTFQALIGASADARNQLLTSGLMSEWGQFSEIWANTMGNGIAGVESYKDIVKTVAKENGVQIDTMIQDMGSFDATLKTGWLTSDIMNESLGRMIKKMTDLSAEELKASGYTQEHVDALVALKLGVDDGRVALGDFSNKMEEMSGRENLIQSLRNVFAGLMSVVNPVKEAFRELFPPMTGEQLYNITAAIESFTSKLILSDDKMDKLNRTAKGVFAIAKVITSFVTTTVKGAVQLFSKLIGATDADILGITATIGDSLVAFQQWVDNTDAISKGFTVAGNIIHSFITTVGNFIKSFIEIPTVHKNLEALKDVIREVFDNSSEYMAIASEYVGEFIDRVKELDTISLSNIKGVFSDLKEKVLGDLADLGFGFTGFKNPLKSFQTNMTKSVKSTGTDMSNLQIKMASFVDFTNSKFKDLNVKDLLTVGLGGGLVLVLQSVSKLMEDLRSPVQAISGMFNTLSGAIKVYVMQIKANTIIKVAGAILALAAAVAVLSMLDQAKVWSSIAALITLGAGLTLMSTVLNSIVNSGNFAGVAVLVAAMSASLLLLSLAIKQMQDLDIGKAISSVLLLGVLASGLTVLVAKLSAAAPKLSTGSVLLLAIAASLYIMVGAIKKLDGLSQDHVDKTMAVLLAAMSGLSLLSVAAGKLKFTGGAAILAASLSLIVLVKAIDQISTIDVSKITKNLGAFAAVIGIFAALMLTTKLAGKNASSAGISIAAISVALILMGSAVKILSGINNTELKQSLVVISSLMLVFAGIIAVSRLAGENAVKAGIMIAIMSTAILELGVAIAFLSALDPAGLDRATNTILKLEGIFALIIAVSSLVKESKGTIIAIGTIIGVLAVALGALSFIEPSALEQSTKSLMLVLGMFGVLMGVSSLAKGSIAVMAVLGIVVAELAGILYLLSNLEVNKSLSIAASISLLMLSLSASLAILSVVGVAIGPALLGIVALDALILDLGLVMVGLGALVDNIPQVETWLNKGIPLLEKIGYGIGSFFGNMASGFTTGSTSNLTQVGENLTQFITSLNPFFDGVKNIDMDSIAGVKALAETMGILTATDVLTKLTSWATGGKSLSNFGDQLVPFGLAMSAYSIAVANVNTEAILASATAAKALAEIATTLPNSGGVAGFFAGENDFGVFSKGLVQFGQAMVSYSLIVAALNTESIEPSVIAAKLLSELANAIPNSGGMAGFFAGENDFGTFSKGLVSFGEAMVNYSIIVALLNVSAIETSVQAARLLTQLMDIMPNSGGIASLFAGDNTFKTLGKGLVSFGETMVNYATVVAGLNIKAITESLKAARDLADMANIDFTGLLDMINIMTVVANTPVNDQASETAANILKAFIQGLSDQQEGIKRKFDDIVGEIQNGLNTIGNSYDDFAQTGRYLVQGFVNGLQENRADIAEAASDMGTTAVVALQNATEVHSPSWITTWIGKMTGQGLVDGMNGQGNNVLNSGIGLGKNALSGVQEGLKGGTGDAIKDFSSFLGGIGKAGNNLGDAGMSGVADGIDKGSKKAKGAAKKAAKSLYDITKEWIDEEKYYKRLSLEDELAKWQEVQAKYKAGTEDRKKIDREVYRVKNEMIERDFNNEKEFIDDERYFKRRSLQQELQYWIEMQEKYNSLGDEYDAQRHESDKKVFQLKEDVLAEAYSKEKEFIDDKKYYGQLSLSEELSYWKGIQGQFIAGSEQRKNAAKEVYRVEKELMKEAFENAKEWIDDRKYYDELSLSEELYAYEQFRDEYEEGSEERIALDKEVYRVEKEIRKAREAHEKEMADLQEETAEKRIELEQDYYDKTKEVNNQLKTDIEAVNKEYEDAVESRAKTIANAYNLWDYAKLGDGVEGQVLLDNLSSQVTAMEDWQKNINGLADRGIAPDLLTDLRNMGPSAAAEIKALNLLTDEQLAQYVLLWQQRQQMAKDQALLELEDMKKQSTDKITELTNAANAKLNEYKTAWDTQLADLNAKATARLTELQNAFDEQIGTISRETRKKVRELTNDIEDAIDVHSEQVTGQMIDLTENIQTAMNTPDWVGLGTNIIMGIQKGITDKAQDLAETAARVARQALEAAEEELDINSPSRKFRNVGMYCDLGFANGLKEYASKVTDQAKDVGKQATEAISNSFDPIWALIDDNTDYTPTIKPIMDLSNVNNGMSKVSAMFSRNQAVALDGMINQSLAAKNQNEVSGSQVINQKYEFNQTNQSPKALSRVDIYRETNNLFAAMERTVKP